MQERERERRPQRPGAGPARRPRGRDTAPPGAAEREDTARGPARPGPALHRRPRRGHRTHGRAFLKQGGLQPLQPPCPLQPATSGKPTRAPAAAISFPVAQSHLVPSPTFRPRAEETPGRAPGPGWSSGRKGGGGAPRSGAGHPAADPWPPALAQGTSAPARGPTEPRALAPDGCRVPAGDSPWCPLQAHSCPRGLHCLRGPLQTTRAAGPRPHPGLGAPSLPPAQGLTEGGGDSRPMRGVFSQRGFWKLAFWLLRHEERRAVTAGRCGPSSGSKGLSWGRADWRPGAHPTLLAPILTSGGAGEGRGTPCALLTALYVPASKGLGASHEPGTVTKGSEGARGHPAAHPGPARARPRPAACLPRGQAQPRASPTSQTQTLQLTEWPPRGLGAGGAQ